MTARATPAQTRFYLLDQQIGGCGRTLVKRVRVRGVVDAARLRRAIGSVLATHPSLRTSLHLDTGGLMQRLHPPEAVPCEVVPVAADEVAERADAIARDAARTVFAHGGLPLCRLAMIFGDGGAEVVFAVHHAVFDEASTGLLLNSLADAYACDNTEAPRDVPVSAPALQPAQRDRQRQFWVGQLAGMPAGTRLPSDEFEVTGRAASRMRVVLEPPLVTRVRLALYERGITSFSLLVAAAGWTVARLCDRDEVVLAAVVDQRTRDTDEAVACLQNTVPIRLAPAAVRTVGEFAERALESVLASVEHARLPIEDILGAVRSSGGAAGEALTSVLCTEGAVPAPLERGELRWLIEDEPPVEVEFDFAVGLLHHQDGAVTLELEYRSGVYDPRYAARVGRCLVRALELLTGPQERLMDHEPLSPPDLAEVLRLASGGPLDMADESLVPEQILDQCAKQPDAIAIDADDATLTYRQLDYGSAALAAALKQQGVGAGDLVGIALGRQAGLAVAVLAIHRLGAAYVPLDPAFPQDRLEMMASDAGLAAVVGHAVGVPDGVPQVDLVIDGYDRAPSATPQRRPQPSDPAYVIYTSGSTGVPKGVVVEQRNLRALLAAFDALTGPLPDAVIAGTSLSFDISALELLWPLARGRRLVLTDHRLLSPDRIPPGSMYQCTPTFASLLLQEPVGRQALARVGTMLVGGEALAPDVASALSSAVGGEVINCYGPTETTVWSTTWRVEPGQRVMIGRPLPGERCYVVDRRGGLLPPGCPGRLLIAGDGVARGYYRRVELTAQRFSALEHADETWAYDTGDLAVMGEDGGLRFLGRSDGQLKILAHRVEPEEVEATLRGHPAVADVIVVPTPANDGLVAYVVVHAEGLVSGSPAGPVPAPDALAAELRTRAADALPAALVPRAYRLASRLPRTPNGKLDRRAAAAWALTERPSTAAVVAGSAADAVREVWARVLNRPIEEVNRTFFELGGTSADLLAVFAVLRQSYPQLSVAHLFRHPTVAALASELASATAASTSVASAGDRGARRRSEMTKWPRRRFPSVADQEMA